MAEFGRSPSIESDADQHLRIRNDGSLLRDLRAWQAHLQHGVVSVSGHFGRCVCTVGLWFVLAEGNDPRGINEYRVGGQRLVSGNLGP